MTCKGSEHRLFSIAHEKTANYSHTVQNQVRNNLSSKNSKTQTHTSFLKIGNESDIHSFVSQIITSSIKNT